MQSTKERLIALFNILEQITLWKNCEGDFNKQDDIMEEIHELLSRYYSLKELGCLFELFKHNRTDEEFIDLLEGLVMKSIKYKITSQLPDDE